MPIISFSFLPISLYSKPSLAKYKLWRYDSQQGCRMEQEWEGSAFLASGMGPEASNTDSGEWDMVSALRYWKPGGVILHRIPWFLDHTEIESYFSKKLKGDIYNRK